MLTSAELIMLREQDLAMAPVPERGRRVKREDETLRLRSGTGQIRKSEFLYSRNLP